MRKRSEVAVTLLALSGLLFGGCSTSNTLPTTTTVSHGATYTQAISELKSYLIDWHRVGPKVAAGEYLEPSQRGGKVELVQGRVISFQPYTWSSPNRFTLLVQLDLHFSGSPGAWNVGHNDRYVTFTRLSTSDHFLMEFNTGL